MSDYDPSLPLTARVRHLHDVISSPGGHGHTILKEVLAVLEGKLMIDSHGRSREVCNHEGHNRRVLHVCDGCGNVTAPRDALEAFHEVAEKEFESGVRGIIPLIKEYRRITGADLKTAKEYVEDLRSKWLVTKLRPPATLPSPSYGPASSPGSLLGPPISIGASPLLPGSMSDYGPDPEWLKTLASQKPRD